MVVENVTYVGKYNSFTGNPHARSHKHKKNCPKSTEGLSKDKDGTVLRLYGLFMICIQIFLQIRKATTKYKMVDLKGKMAP